MISKNNRNPDIVSFISNPDLPSLKVPFEWEGTPRDANGRFVNHEYPFRDSFKDLLKWQLSKNPQKQEKKSDTWRLPVTPNEAFLTEERDCVVWFGHATFFVRLAGISLLIDPVFFNVSLVKRHSALPCDPGKISTLDYILISHDHRDHCDSKSLKVLAANNPDATYLTGLGIADVITKYTKASKIQEAGWYQEFDTKNGIRVSYLPTRHWGRRYIRDTNVRLWGGFVIQGAGKTVYFGSDSGYGSHYKDLAAVFPEIDLCMLGIGAYKPEFFMAQSHMSPTDAYQAFKETKAKKMIPMHFGTFDLSNEPLGDPLKVLQKITDANQESRILFPTVGEEVLL